MLIDTAWGFNPTDMPQVDGFEAKSAPRSSLKPLKITSNDAPISAAIAAQREAKPKKVKATKITLIESERAMFIRMMPSARRE